MSQIEQLASQAAKLAAPPPDLKPTDWADKYRYLSPESCAMPGKYRSDVTPFARGIQDACCEEGVHRIAVMACSQIIKSTAAENICGFFICEEPAPILLIEPTLEMAETFSKDRLAPMIRDTPVLTGKVKEAKARDSGNTLLHKSFPGGHITLAGANSPASLAMRPVRVVICDEVDRFPVSAGSEGDPISLAEKRTTTFVANWLIVMLSSPTLEGSSRIASEFEKSDQRRYFVPCPLCKKVQVLKWPQIRFEYDEVKSGDKIRKVAKNVRYCCEHCEQDFTDAKKDWMLQNGDWIATAPFTGTVGFHLNELYSPWKKFADVVQAFLDKKDDPEQLKTWTNTSLGETWKEKGIAPEHKRLFERCETFKRNTIATKLIYFLTAGVDCQADRLEVEIVGWGRDKQSWSIDYRVFEGDTATQSPWKKLDELLVEEWEHPEGFLLPIKKLAVDSGYRTQHVYAWARRHPRLRVMATKGRDGASSFLNPPSAVDLKFSGKRAARGFQIWPIGSNHGKSELYSWLNLDRNDDGSYPPGYCHFPEYSEEHFKRLCSEQVVIRKMRGYPRHIWEKTHERNEQLDCRVLARAAAESVGIDRMKDHQWETLLRGSAITPIKASRSGENSESSESGNGIKWEKGSWL